MGRLLILFLMLPWWAYLPVAGGVAWLGEKAHVQAVAQEARYEAARMAGAPEAVDLAAFDPDLHANAAREVVVQGWIDTDRNYELVERTNGVPTTRRYMFMMFGAADPAGSREVRAAMVLTAAERDRFVDTVEAWAVGFGATGPVFEINGFAASGATLGSLARDAIEDEGLRPAADFFYLEPFFDGREAALAPHGAPAKERAIFWLVAAGVALLGLGKRAILGRRREPRAIDLLAGAPQAGPAAEAPLAPQASTIAPDSPLGRLAAKRAGGRRPQQAAEPLPPLPRAGRPGAERPRVRRVALRSAGTAAAHAAAPGVEPPARAEADGARGLLDPAYLARLALGMLAVGLLAYDSRLVASLLPVVAVLAFWVGVGRLVGRLRRGLAGLLSRARPQGI